MTAINTNINAIAAQNSLRVSGLNQATAMERLSTGIRINSARDDAAGLAISTRMTANIRGISAAIRNANDGISLTQTAEGSLISIGDNLQRIRELAVQSANSGNNASDRAALNNEASQLISEIDRIANNSTFNGIKLLDGSYNDQSLQVGSGNENNDRINISIGDARTARLGAAPTASVSGSAISDGVKLKEGDITINGFNVIGSTSDGVSIHNSEGSAIAKANAINAISSKTGVVAAAKASVFTFTATAGSGGDFAFLLNGEVIKGDVEGGTNDVGSASNIAAAINAKTSKTGVFATVSNEEGHEGEFTLTASDGRNIVLSKNTADLKIASGDETLIGDWGNTGIAEALQGKATTTTTGTPPVSTTTYGTPDIASFEMHPGATADPTKKDSVVIYGAIELTTDSLAGITLGGDKALESVIGVTGSYIPASKSSGSGVGSVNLNTASGAQSALTTLDRAINAVTDMRASMGAYQNRLTASIANLENTSMNLTASRSRILDTDYAKETTNLAKAQIIQQAATAMLAQANQSSQSVLALLK